MKKEEVLSGFMLILNRLQQAGKILGKETIIPFAEMKLPDVAAFYDDLVSILLKKEMITGNADQFTLTEAGQTFAAEVSEKNSLHAFFYNAYYQAVLNSPAHAQFCEQVYGKDLCQHGMADMGQLKGLMDALEVHAGMSMLDFGCGDGRISEFLSDGYQLNVTGVDIADQAIQLALTRTESKRDHLQYFSANIEKSPGFFPEAVYDRIIAIDSIFFTRNLKTTLRTMLNSLFPNGRMGLFYIAPPETDANSTPLAVTLNEMGLSFTSLDFSQQNHAHWVKKKSILKQLEVDFMEEGSHFLYKNRMAECQGNLDQFQRYLYLISKN